METKKKLRAENERLRKMMEYGTPPPASLGNPFRVSINTIDNDRTLYPNTHAALVGLADRLRVNEGAYRVVAAHRDQLCDQVAALKRTVRQSVDEKRQLRADLETSQRNHADTVKAKNHWKTVAGMLRFELDERNVTANAPAVEPVLVVETNSHIETFPNGHAWLVASDGNLFIRDAEGTSKAVFARGQWSSVVKSLAEK